MELVRTIFHLALGMFLACGKPSLSFTAGSLAMRQHCPDEVFTLTCEALKEVEQINQLEWKLNVSDAHKSRKRLAFCNGSLRCGMAKNSAVETHGITVLGISNGTLSVKRSSRKATSRTVELFCRVQTVFRSIIHRVKIDLSLECIWTHAGATVNLTSHLINMLPWKRHEVELFNPGSDKNRIAYCKSTSVTHRCVLLKGYQKAFGSRLKVIQGSILLEGIQESDNGSEIWVKAECNSSCDEADGKTLSREVQNFNPRFFTLRIRLRPRQEPTATSQTGTSALNTTSEDSREFEEFQHQGHDSPLKVKTESGAVVGKIETLSHGKSVHEYLGIPYAKPPIGQLRFAAPQPATPWPGIREARRYRAACPQPDSTVPNQFTSKVGKEDEDCLYLNVFVPTTANRNSKMAVMVWIYGGGFEIGSSTQYPGHVLAAFNDVIVVTFNYRLGVLGFLNIPGTDVKGNYGMFDQVLALKWVQSNIANFGGDPNRVTIFGEHAGGTSVSLHLISPKSQGLFQRVIAQSGAGSSPYVAANKEPNTEALQKFAKLANCPSFRELVRCLSDKGAEEIVSLQRNMSLSSPTYGMEITTPVVDGDFIPDSPQKMFKQGKFHRNIDVISGFLSLNAVLGKQNGTQYGVTREAFEAAVSNTLEMGGQKSRLVEEMVKYEYTAHIDPHNKAKIRTMMSDVEKDMMFVSPAIFEAKALAKARCNVYLYVFEHRPDFSTFRPWAGALRGADIGFVFGAPFKRASSIIDVFTPGYSDIEKGFSLHVMKLWTDFAKFGSPTPSGSNSPVTWSPYTKEEQVYLSLDVKPKLMQKYRAKQVAFWNNLIPKVIKQAKRLATARRL